MMLGCLTLVFARCAHVPSSPEGTPDVAPQEAKVQRTESFTDLSTKTSNPLERVTPQLTEALPSSEVEDRDLPMARESSELEIFDSEQIKFKTDLKIWKPVSNKDGVTTYQEIRPKQDVVAFRGEMRIPTSVKKIATVLSDPDIRKQWVDGLVETRTVQLISSTERIEYNHTDVPWPFHDRDFVYHVNVQSSHEPVSMLITMISVKDPREPERSGIVRGEILHAYYYMKENPGPNPSSDVVIEMAADPKGAIPTWAVNLTQKKWPHNTLLELKKIAMRPDLMVSKEVDDYFNSSHPLKARKRK